MRCFASHEFSVFYLTGIACLLADRDVWFGFISRELGVRFWGLPGLMFLACIFARIRLVVLKNLDIKFL
jgi:hypothetical protein